MDGVILPKSKNAKEKFNRILVAAAQQIYENGFEKASIANITSAADVAVGTFYLYFQDKLSLYHYLLLDTQERIKDYINLRIGECKSREEKERIGIIAWLEFVNNNPHTYSIIWQSLAIDKSLFVDYYKKFSSSYMHGLVKDKDQLIETDYETTALALMGISSFLGLKTMFIEGKKLTEVEINKMADSIMKILKNGLFKI